MILSSERLILRPWELTDANDLYQLAKNPKVGPITGWPVHKSEAESQKIIQNILMDDESFAIVLKEDNALIGSIGLHKPGHNLSIDENATELGFWLGEDYWNRGYATEASRLILDLAFESLGYDSVWAGFFEGNLKSKRVQDKLGFTAHHIEENNTTTSWVKQGQFTFLGLTKKIGRGEMEANVELNKKNYKLALYEQCDCIFCSFYRRHVKEAYPMLNIYLSNIGMDIEKPLEIDMPHINDEGLIEYPLIQYLTIGSCDLDAIEKIDDVNLTKASSYPGVNVSGEHFVIDVFPLVFDKKLANAELLESIEN